MVLGVSGLDVEGETLHSRGKIRSIRRSAVVTACSTAGHGMGGGHDGGGVAPSLGQHYENLSLKLVQHVKGQNSSCISITLYIGEI